MKIRGNTVGTPIPRSDWSQENPNRADYIRNKPNVAEIDDTKVVEDKTWSSSRIYGQILSDRSAANKYTDTKVSQIINDTTVSDKAWSSKNTVDKLCPSFEITGDYVECEPLEGYPLEVVSTINEKADGSAWNSITLHQSGKNLINVADLLYNRELLNSSGVIGVAEGWYVTAWIPVFPSTTYTISGTSSAFRAEADENLKNVSGSNFDPKRTFTTTEKTRYVRFNSKINGYSTPQLELGNIATAYEPYKELRTFTVDIPTLSDGDNNYELLFGSYNWRTGVLDSGKNGLYQHNLEDGSFAYIENIQNYVPPIVRNIPALPGTNYLYSDCGDTEVKGKSDPVKIIEKLTNAILSLGGNV